MFKLVVLSALLALAAAAPTPGHLYSHQAAVPLVASSVPVYSSAVVGTIPTGYSRQSTTYVHQAPVVAPVVHSVPYVHSAPLVRTIPVAHHAAVAVQPSHLAYGHNVW